ncbi:AAA family ATPase [Butyrivibrio sp. FCS014]|uniref:AAA family ATPase n=1 Tax=Butyrivibrio sp. FCS014 TaxID=1408304 RepID=UPI0004BA02F6|nr:AAA family ATPase [Butyrivibrio sp. FCS014]
MGEVIVITSGKGGVGKTTTTANIGTGLAKLNKKVVLIDTDIGLRNLDVWLWVLRTVSSTTSLMLSRRTVNLRQALIKDKRYDTLFLLPAAQTRDKHSVHPEQMKKLTEELKEEFDYIILDCPGRNRAGLP